MAGVCFLLDLADFFRHDPPPDVCQPEVHMLARFSASFSSKALLASFATYTLATATLAIAGGVAPATNPAPTNASGAKTADASPVSAVKLSRQSESDPDLLVNAAIIEKLTRQLPEITFDRVALSDIINSCAM
jgi:hypothetical protein